MATETFPIEIRCSICGDLIRVAYWPRNLDGTIPTGPSHGICGKPECQLKLRGAANG
jgi:hypothetical protein